MKNTDKKTIKWDRLERISDTIFVVMLVVSGVISAYDLIFVDGRLDIVVIMCLCSIVMTILLYFLWLLRNIRNLLIDAKYEHFKAHQMCGEILKKLDEKIRENQKNNENQP